MTSPLSTSVLPGAAAGRPVTTGDTGQDGTSDLGVRRHLPRSTSSEVSVAGTAPDQVVPATHPCGCPGTSGRHITDAAAHAAWHALVLEQGGPAGEVNAVTLRAARGFKTETLHAETLLDERARKSGKRVNGARRRAARDD